MIINPCAGWCNFELENFKGHPSYLTDVPIDLLDAFIDYHTKGTGIAWFDEEGSDFTLVLTPYSVFIIEEKSCPILHSCKKSVVTLEEELIKDLESDLTGWANFLTDNDSEEVKQHRAEIKCRLVKLKELISKRR